ncbi:MAG: hypothetical protein ACP5PM_09385 [Acidimicrobiales bacterium]
MTARELVDVVSWRCRAVWEAKKLPPRTAEQMRRKERVAHAGIGMGAFDRRQTRMT